MKAKSPWEPPANARLLTTRRWKCRARPLGDIALRCGGPHERTIGNPGVWEPISAARTHGQRNKRNSPGSCSVHAVLRVCGSSKWWEHWKERSASAVCGEQQERRDLEMAGPREANSCLVGECAGGRVFRQCQSESHSHGGLRAVEWMRHEGGYY